MKPRNRLLKTAGANGTTCYVLVDDDEYQEAQSGFLKQTREREKVRASENKRIEDGIRERKLWYQLQEAWYDHLIKNTPVDVGADHVGYAAVDIPAHALAKARWRFDEADRWLKTYAGERPGSLGEMLAFIRRIGTGC